MTGVALISPAPKQIDRKNGQLVLFDNSSKSQISPIFQVTDTAYSIVAYGLTGSSRVELETVSLFNGVVFAAPFSFNGIKVTLTVDNPVGIVALTGQYRLRFTGQAGTILCIATPQIDNSSTSHIRRSDKSKPNYLSDSFDTSIFSPILDVVGSSWTISLYNATTQKIYVRAAIDENNHVRTGEVIDIDNPVHIIENTGRYLFELEGTPDVTLVGTQNFVDFESAYVLQGPQGEPGPPGEASSYEHIQNTPATQWVINHNLGYYPSVELLTVGGKEFEADVTHTTPNQVVVNSLIAIAGRARLT